MVLGQAFAADTSTTAIGAINSSVTGAAAAIAVTALATIYQKTPSFSMAICKTGTVFLAGLAPAVYAANTNKGNAALGGFLAAGTITTLFFFANLFTGLDKL
jgi:hypothetical protein